MDEYLKANQAWWNEVVPVHARSAMYDLAGFKAGKTSLMPIELDELGAVAGKSLLHLQCHFGMDTLSWARLGARVTGVDFSDEAIRVARSLSAELGIPARFICSSIYDLPGALTEQFDIVFTSYGVLCWLPDLTGWAQLIAHFLKPGGTFYIVEMHPFANIFYDEDDATEPRVAYPYFGSGEPSRWEGATDYADRRAQLSQTVTYDWPHGLGEIVTVLGAAGLRIEFLHEFPYCVYRRFPFLAQGEDGWWRPQERENAIPLMFSLRASKA